MPPQVIGYGVNAPMQWAPMLHKACYVSTTNNIFCISVISLKAMYTVSQKKQTLKLLLITSPNVNTL